MVKKHLRLYKYIVISLLLVHFILAVTSMIQKSSTSDELLHVVAGYSYLTERDFRYNPEHPPLVKEIAAFPLLFLDLNLEKGNAWNNAYEWIAGKEFFFKDNENADLILFLGRLMMILISCLLAYFIFKFASELYGNKAGVFALFLYIFSVNILAHARIVQTDLPAALIILMGIYFFRKLLMNPNLKNVLINGLIFGIALSIKFTTIYLLIFYIVLFITFIVIKRYTKKERNEIYEIFTKNSIKRFIKYSIIILVIPLIILFIVYGFNFDLYNNQLKKEIVEHAVGDNFIGKVSYGVVKFVPVPSYYLQGLKQVVKQSKTGYRAYIMGQYKKGGWWYYFPIAFLIKTPIAMLLLIILALIFLKKLKKNWMDELFLIIPALLYFLFFIPSQLNIGLRHILPVYVFLFIFVSKIINHKKFLIKFLIIILSIWYLISSLIIFPNYLAYFNEIVTPDYGHNFLIDSNLDWGQDLKGLKKYLDKNEIKDKIYLSYWGPDDPDYRNINYEFYRRIMDDNEVCQEVKGYIAVSVNHLVGMKEYESYCFDWLDKYEPITKIGYSIWVYKI